MRQTIKQSRQKRREVEIDDPSHINEPFYFDGATDYAVLLIHGWSSTPYEMRALGKHLQAKGYSVLAPLLSGHGTRPEDLEGLVWQDWLGDVVDAYRRLSESHSRVYVGGMSTGGSLALHVAFRFPDVAGIVLMGTPYRMRYERIGYYIVNVLKTFRPYKKKYYPKILGNERGMSELIAYDKYPYDSAFEALYAIRSATRMLWTIQAPCFIIQSQHDHLIARNSMALLERGLTKSHVSTLMIKKAYHNFIADKKNHYIFEEITDFLEDNSLRIS